MEHMVMMRHEHHTPVAQKVWEMPKEVLGSGVQSGALHELLWDSLCFRHEELDRLARERDEVLAAVKDAHVEQLRVLESRALELQAHCETLELQLHRAEQRQADALKEKDAVIDR